MSAAQRAVGRPGFPSLSDLGLLPPDTAIQLRMEKSQSKYSSNAFFHEGLAETSHFHLQPIFLLGSYTTCNLNTKTGQDLHKARTVWYFFILIFAQIVN